MRLGWTLLVENACALIALGMVLTPGPNISVSVNAAIAISAGSIAAFLVRRPSFAVVQRRVMGTVLAALAVRMASEARR